MNNEYKEYFVRVAPTVNDRMYDHFEFLARVNEAAAKKLLDNLVADMQSLQNMPYRNPVFDRPYLKNGKYRYMVSCVRYLIVYQVIENTVHIEDIQDSRQSDDKSPLYP